MNAFEIALFDNESALSVSGEVLSFRSVRTFLQINICSSAILMLLGKIATDDIFIVIWMDVLLF